MNSDVEHQVERLGDLDLEGLRAEWRARYGPPPPLRSVPLLRLSLAWAIQADAFGGVDAETRRELKRKGTAQPEGLGLGVGARLRREWKGRLVEVEVEETGFRWEGRVFASLSAAATAIAGSRWNGPRFFGLREQQP